MRKYQAGYYRGRGVAGSEQHGYANSGSEQISLDLDVQISDQEVVRLTTIMSFSGGAAEYSIERLKALGWDGSNELRGIDQNEVDVEIKYEVPPGRSEEVMRVEIKTGGGRFTFKKPMADAEKRGFMAQLSRQAAQLAGGGGGAGGGGQGGGGRGYPDSWDGPPAQGQRQGQEQAPPQGRGPGKNYAL